MTSSPTIRLGLDIGGTFTDVALEIGERRFTAKTLTTPGAPEEGVLAALAFGDASGGHRAAPGRLDHSRHDARHQCGDRAQGRQDRAVDHRRLPRRDRNPPREPLRAIRRQHRSAAASGAAPLALSGARTHRCAGQCAGAAGRSEPRPRDRAARRARGRGGGDRLSPQLHQSGSRAPHRRCDRPALAQRRGDAVVRRVAGDARIRAFFHRLRQRLHPAADGALSCRARTRAHSAPALSARSC